jgi:hypothetical protein
VAPLARTQHTIGWASGVALALLDKHARPRSCGRRVEDFKAALIGALPAALIGGADTKRLKTADELAALSAKLAAGTATKEDETRLRKLAARV